MLRLLPSQPCQDLVICVKVSALSGHLLILQTCTYIWEARCSHSLHAGNGGADGRTCAQTKAKAANMRLSIEVRRAGLTGKPRAPGPGQPALVHPKPAGLPPSLLYQGSPSQSGGSSGDGGGRGRSGERSQKDMRKHLGSKSSSKNLSASPCVDDRLGLNEVARMKDSMGGSVGSYTSCHSESGFTHTAAHLSFTEIKQQKSKNLAAGLSVLQESLLPETERINSCTEARADRDFVSIGDAKYVPSGSLEKMGSTLPQIRISSAGYRY